MDTSSSSSIPNVKRTLPTPGTPVFIARGDFGGEVATVGALVAPEAAHQAGHTLNVVFEPHVVFDGVRIIAAFVDPNNVQPVPTDLVDVPTEYDRSKVDPWTERIARWLTSLGGESRLVAGLTTGEIVEYAVEVEDGFTQQIRVGQIMRSLGYEKVERRISGSKVWYWVPVNGFKLEPESTKLQREPPYVAVPGTSAGLVTALGCLISWLLDRSGNVERLAQLATLILQSPLFKLQSTNLAYFQWVESGASILRKLQMELVAQDIAGSKPVYPLLEHVIAKGLELDEIEQFHRNILPALIEGRRERAGIDSTGLAHDRTPEVNGWLEALSLQADTARNIAVEMDAGRGVPEGADGHDLAFEYLAQENALRWLVDAAGGLPKENESSVLPMLELAEYVDTVVREALNTPQFVFKRENAQDTVKPPADEVPS